MDTPALVCRGLVKRYGDLVAVAGLDLEVRRGECFGLLGPNGAGKTTTVEILEGLTPADAGTVEVLDERWGGGRDRELRERLGVQLQETQLAEKLTVLETLQLFRSFYRRGRPVEETVDLAGLGEKRLARVGKLSGGQRPRLALACALVSDPELLFLDEPTTGLDPQARRKVWDLVGEFRARGGTALLTTHYMEEAARLCDRVAIVDHGRIIAQDTPDALVASLGASQVVEFRAARPLAEPDLLALSGVHGTGARGEHQVLHTERIGETLPALLGRLGAEGVALVDLQTRQATLEDVFIHLTGRTLHDA